MADEKASEDTDAPKGTLHPDASNEPVQAPPLSVVPKLPPKRKAGGGGSATAKVDESGCSGVEAPDDPAFRGSRY